VEAARGTNLTSHESLPLLPPVRAVVGLGWRDRLSVDVDANARPTRLNPLDVPTPGYALLHLGGGTEVRVFGRSMRLDISLRNALNQRYRSFLSRYKEFAFDPGRNLIVRLSSGFVD
jgi:outer membrane receptor protein involved in Fe transport